jgi:hypothetical protein
VPAHFTKHALRPLLRQIGQPGGVTQFKSKFARKKHSLGAIAHLALGSPCLFAAQKLHHGSATNWALAFDRRSAIFGGDRLHRRHFARSLALDTVAFYIGGGRSRPSSWQSHNYLSPKVGRKNGCRMFFCDVGNGLKAQNATIAKALGQARVDFLFYYVALATGIQRP